MSKAKKKSGNKNKGAEVADAQATIEVQAEVVDTAVATEVVPPASEVVPPTVVEPTGEAVQIQNDPVVEAPKVEKVKRIAKNFTAATIDPNNPLSGVEWLANFVSQCEKHPPRKGYDQHWNNLGFIHTGPAKRLTNQGCARMVVVIGDALAQRSLDGDVEADAFIDFAINFLSTQRDNAREARKAAKLKAAMDVINELAPGKVAVQ